jgi:hypothetical protein
MECSPKLEPAESKSKYEMIVGLLGDGPLMITPPPEIPEIVEAARAGRLVGFAKPE